MKFLHFQSGQSLIELVVAIGISALLIPALFTGLLASRDGKAQLAQRSQATTLLKEANEAIRNIREKGWTTFAVNGTYHPQISGSSWTLANNSEVINGFTRSLVISDVFRDANGTIVSSGGTVDPSTKKVVTTVSWTLPYPSSMQSTTYLTRYLNNLTYIQTTQTDFNAGVNSGTTVAATVGTGIPDDGQVQLAAGGGGNWCNPGTSVVATYDLPGQGVAEEISATTSATQDIAYITNGGNSSGDAVDGLTISHTSPPVIANPSSNNEAKAYGIFVDSTGSYVYFNENNPSNHTVRIVNASNLSDVGYFDVFHATGTSIFALSNTGYTTVGSTLYSFDVSSKTGSRPQLGSVSLAGTGNRVVVIGTKAYVATSSTTSQLQIIDVSNPTDMEIIKSINIGNGQGGVDVYVNNTQTYAYVATSYASGNNDFFIIDLNNTSNIYGYSTNGMNPKGITVVPGNKAILVGSGGTVYQVFDITTPNAAFYCGGMNPSGVTTINAVAPVIQSSGNAFSYIITDNASAEFQMIAGGPGGQFATSGTFTSSIFDMGYSSAVNRFVATVSQPTNTTISLQVAVAAIGSDGTCNTSTYSYIGPDGTSNTYFTPSGTTIQAQVPLITSDSYQNPGRCLRYKAYFSTTDISSSPTLYDITFNYSP